MPRYLNVSLGGWRGKVNPSTLEKWDKRFLWHPFTPQSLWEKEPQLIIKSGKGVRLIDHRGKSYIDGVSSLWVNLLGHNNPALNKALINQVKKISHSTFLGLSHEPAIQLGRELIKVAPKGLKRVFYSDNGSGAVEIALKMAFQFWVEKGIKQRTEFLALRGSYHGDTLGAVSVGGIGQFHSKFKPLLFKAQFAMAPKCVGCPFNKKKVKHRTRLGETVSLVPKPGQPRPETGCRWECLSDVEKILKKRSSRISAGIIEPVVQGAGGMIVMPPGYLAGFKRLLNRYNVLLIADEVAVGFGRTGSLFACQQERVTPDILCLAKAITGGYSPLAATLTTNAIYKAFLGPRNAPRTFFHGHSYTAHPLGAAVALANLHQIKSINLLEITRRKAHLMKDELKALKHLPFVGSVRQAGLMAGVELVKNNARNQPFPPQLRMGARICKKLLSYGIWVRPLGDVIVLIPPPIITDRDLRTLVRSIGNVILHECKT